MLLSVDAATSFLHNNQAFPHSQYVRGEFFLVDDTGDEVFIGNSYDDPGTITVISGIYDMEYRHVQGDTVPLNKKTVVRTNVDLATGRDASVNVISFMLDVNLTLNGQAFQVSEYQDGILELRDVVTGGLFFIGEYSRRVRGSGHYPGDL